MRVWDAVCSWWGGRRGFVPEEEEEGEGEGEVGEELGVRGGHAVAFAVHFCYHVSAKVPVTHPSIIPISIRRRHTPRAASNWYCSQWEMHTFRPLLLNQPLQ